MRTFPPRTGRSIPAAFFDAAVRILLAWALLLGPGSLRSEEEPDSADSEQEPAPPPRRQIVDPDLVPSIGKSRSGTVEIRGLVSVSEEEARDAIRLQLRKLEENGVTMARADDAAFFLEKTLRGLGHDESTVNWQMPDADTVILNVSEGREVFFGEVDVVGNENLSTEAIRELLTQATRKRLGYRLDASRIPYVADDVAEGIKAIDHLYALLGFADASVEMDPPVLDSETKSMNLRVRIGEGIPSRVGAILFPTAPVPEIEETFPGVREEFLGKPFTEAVRANLENKILDAAKNAGYLDAVVEIHPGKPHRETLPSEGDEPSASEVDVVDLAITAAWGSQFTLARVDVTGISRIDEGVIERRFTPLIGQTYSPEKVSEEVSSLLESGAFETLTMDPLPETEGTLALAIEVTESKQRTLGVYGGFGTYEGIIIGAEYRNTNFRQRLHTFDAALELNGRGLRGKMEFKDPRFFDSRWGFLIGLDARNQSNEGYDVFEAGFKIGLQRDFGRKERNRFTVFANPQHQEITEADIPDAFLGPQKYFVSQVGAMYSFDGRDDPVSARRGFAADLLVAGANSAIGSEVDFFKAAAKATYQLPIGATTLRLGARVGIIDPGDDEALPIDLRFFSGGARSIRSFRERDLGPRVNGYPIGGEFVTVFNFEYEIPVAGPLSIAPFVDAGNLLPRAEDASLDDMHYAGGAGLILNSPIGPFRIDYGHNLNQKSREPSGTWHVGFGFAF